tara:strand:+ start:1965 stop:2627 length:663 start_codon:yes stop_codon:yes gene_type:complete
MNPIVLDLETSGLDKSKCGIWQIGAIDLNTKEEFMEEGRIDNEDSIEEDALRVIGKTKEELRDKTKQTQKELINNFFEWVRTRKIRNLLCQNPQFDISFLELKANKYGLRKTFQFRAFDLHTVSQIIFFNINKKFSLRKNYNAEKLESDMDLSNILSFCGIPDHRRITRNSEIIQEGTPHNALDDCKLAGECFSRLVDKKNLFQEYSKHEIPNYLKGEEK